jgi:uncharacterized peroxidase-related enzyme
MSRFSTIDPNVATGKAKELLDAVHGKLGVVPNMMRTMAHAPAVLEAYLSFSGALAKGSFSPKLREAIALAVGQANSCQYCVSAHTLIGQKAGLKTDEVVAARHGVASDERTTAVLKLALAINNNQGRPTDADLSTARAAGLSDSDIIETVGNVALNVFTNYFNHVTDPKVDFPVVQL